MTVNTEQTEDSGLFGTAHTEQQRYLGVFGSKCLVQDELQDFKAALPLHVHTGMMVVCRHPVDLRTLL